MAIIYVDSREAAEHPSLVSFLSQHVLVEEVVLECGDFLLTADPSKRPLLVERKTVPDFLNSLRSKRLFDQLVGLCAQKELMDVIILLEGNLWQVEKFRKWPIASLVREMDSIELVWKVPILPVLNQRWTAVWLVSKAKELDQPYVKREFAMRSVPRHLTLQERQLYVMEGVGGRAVARALLEKFGSIEGVVRASEEELKIKGLIGEKKAKEIYAILHAPFEA
jgi:ERCC4-type nuclease